LLPSSKQGMNINLLCGKNFVHPKNPSLCTWWWLTFNKNLSISKVIITCYVYNMNLHCGFNWISNAFSFFYVMGSCTNIAYTPLLHRTSYKYNSYNSFPNYIINHTNAMYAISCIT
jgi:hypothetical protein